ncbi:MAG: thioredoxin [Thermomicrobiales bacterium]|jgi:thioredoxin 1|nr:thioredoxin [Thermomicrobiales bacterium]MCC6943400.1 thioredoxin [Thermomicrobiales bacterium]
MTKPVEITDDQFEDEVVKSDKLVIVDFWAPWCGPCRAMAPVLSELAKDRSESVKVVKVNVDEQQVNAAKLGIMTIPTLIMFKNGEPVDRMMGGYPKRSIVDRVEKQLTAATA